MDGQDDNRYLKSTFLRLNPSKIIKPPTKAFDLVGFACPPCLALGVMTPLKYICFKNQAWTVACGLPLPPQLPSQPKPRGHFYRTWAVPQLTYEIAMTNSRRWPVVPFAHPFPVQGPPGPNATPSQRLLNQLLGPAPASSSTKTDHGLICNGVEGKTASHQMGERRKGNSQCFYKACVSCCQTHGVHKCTAKRHNHNKPAMSPEPVASDLPHHVMNCTSKQPRPATSRPQSQATHNKLPHQSVQTGGLIAHDCTTQQLARFIDLRSKRDHEMSTNKQIEINKKNVVNVIAWLKADKDPRLITFLAPKWPAFSLEQCLPLVEDAAVAEALSVGHWSCTLHLWCSKFKGWRDLPIHLPERLPAHHPHSIFVKLQGIDTAQCHRLDWFLYTTYAGDDPTPTLSTSTSPSRRCLAGPSGSTADKTPRVEDNTPHVEDGDRKREIIFVGESTSQPGRPPAPISAQPGPCPSSPASVASKKKEQYNEVHQQACWPNLEAPMRDLEDWINLTSTGLDRMQAWKVAFGDFFLRMESTIHRYGRWICKLVKDNKLGPWEAEQHAAGKDVTILAARNHFHREFAGSSKNEEKQASVTEHTEETGQSTKKRKRGHSQSTYAFSPVRDVSTNLISAPCLRDDHRSTFKLKARAMATHVVSIFVRMMNNREKVLSRVVEPNQSHPARMLVVTNTGGNNNTTCTTLEPDRSESIFVRMMNRREKAEPKKTIVDLDLHKMTLHSLIGMANFALSKDVIAQFDTLHLGNVTLPILEFNPATPMCDANVTMLVLTCDQGGEPGFKSRTAKLTVTKKLDSPRKLSVYTGIAQSNLHIAISLARFCKHLTNLLQPHDFTADKRVVIQGLQVGFFSLVLRLEDVAQWALLQFQENMVGILQPPNTPPAAHPHLECFTAEELLCDPREKYSSETSFKGPPREHVGCPVRLLLEAFSHWSYEASNRSSVICGFQGVGTIITEAVIHDVERRWTIGNLGVSWVDYFPKQHVCRKFCHKQGIAFPKLAPKPIVSEEDW
ncbi:uncharacterized protein MELLADRAFT_87460 [Melampsora larici-populina 98AG31]|uniref:Alpha-type protein kinase domain-containing protein n=1 Tax=Melampsora larici-populina (strain 98AG31 / pathotype 3-4-7) TaxID=747676 RepID=F4RND8_MELLP|nr:uncharacterized protein MELLADRAFT_87460 [Melampsora larici-populina 98AG31]EGG06113.1 hypothetical protein MELLADRAFT_87460 [Melampsora larici-populina 98AG31]